jgi:hypothetical protein
MERVNLRPLILAVLSLKLHRRGRREKVLKERQAKGRGDSAFVVAGCARDDVSERK